MKPRDTASIALAVVVVALIGFLIWEVSRPADVTSSAPSAYVPGSPRARAEAAALNAPDPAPAFSALGAIGAAGLLALGVGAIILFVLAVLMPFFIYRIHAHIKEIVAELRAIRAALKK